jgi:hypothetical protein
MTTGVIAATLKKSPKGLRIGVVMARPVTAVDRNHMLAIMTSPNPEQLTWVAPSIRRAKS